MAMEKRTALGAMSTLELVGHGNQLEVSGQEVEIIYDDFKSSFLVNWLIQEKDVKKDIKDDKYSFRDF